MSDTSIISLEDVCCALGMPPSGVRDAPQALLQEAHERFVQALCSVQVSAGARDLLAVWLSEAVEVELAAAWAESPEKALWLHGTAQCVCMRAVAQTAPYVAQLGCAPVPYGDAEAVTALRNAGLACELVESAAEKCTPGGGLRGKMPVHSMGPCAAPSVGRYERQYTVVTYATLPDGKTGCAACALQATCPGPSARVRGLRKRWAV